MLAHSVLCPAPPACAWCARPSGKCRISGAEIRLSRLRLRSHPFCACCRCAFLVSCSRLLQPHSMMGHFFDGPGLAILFVFGGYCNACLPRVLPEGRWTLEGLGASTCQCRRRASLAGLRGHGIAPAAPPYPTPGRGAGPRTWNSGVCDNNSSHIAGARSMSQSRKVAISDNIL